MIPGRKTVNHPGNPWAEKYIRLPEQIQQLGSAPVGLAQLRNS